MPFIAKNPLTIPEVESPTSVPKTGTRGLFAGKDGWYDVDSDNVIKKLGGSSDVDQSYDATSENAQSGIAVAEAISDCAPIIEIVPRENSNVYQFSKGSNGAFGTVRWCDNADGDRNRVLSFAAKCICYAPYYTHSWRVEVRNARDQSVSLIAIGSDGAGNTVVYGHDESVKVGNVFTDGWHDYTIKWSADTGNYSIIIDGIELYSGNNPSLVMGRGHGIQISGNWTKQTDKPEIFAIDYWKVAYINEQNEMVERIFDDFNDIAVGTEVPIEGIKWMKLNDSTNNVREVVLSEDSEMYLQITDVSGIKRTGNIRGKDGAELTEGNITTEYLADGAVTTDKIADKTITGDKIGISTIKTENISPNSIVKEHLADGCVTNNEIADKTITIEKIEESLKNEIESKANQDYVDSIIGNIETALEWIIEIQNELIGGDSV